MTISGTSTNNEVSLQQSNTRSTLSRRRKKTQELLKGYIDNLTIHGATKILTGSIPERIFWAILLFGILVYFFYSSRILYLNFLSKRVHSDIENVDVDELPLPSITLCDYKIFQCTAKVYNSSSRNCEKEKVAKWLLNFESRARCWDSDARKFSKTTCNFGQTSNHPGCITFNANQTIKQKASGKQYNAYFEIVPTLYTGVFLFLHKRNEAPIDFIDRHENVIRYGHTDIILQRRDVKRLPAPYQSNCSSQRISNSLEYPSYSKSLCKQACYARNMLDQCGAINDLWFSYLPPALKKMHQRHHVNKTEQEIRNCIYGFVHGFLPDCKCQQSCEETVFATRVNKIMEYP